jgi:hypothetical protein
LKKKRECEIEKGEGDIRETCRMSASLVPYSTPWCAHVHVYTESAKEPNVLQ